MCLACITTYNTTYAGRCSERPPVILRNHMICGEESATLQKSAPRARRLTSLENVFQLTSLKKCVILFIAARKKSANNPCHSGSFFRIRSSHVNLNWLILLQANLTPTEIEFFFVVNGIATKVKCFSYINARMAQSVLCHFERRLGLTQSTKLERLRTVNMFACLLRRAEHSFC